MLTSFSVEIIVKNRCKTLSYIVLHCLTSIFVLHCLTLVEIIGIIVFLFLFVTPEKNIEQ
jgi:hypothetical protein